MLDHVITVKDLLYIGGAAFVLVALLIYILLAFEAGDFNRRDD